MDRALPSWFSSFVADDTHTLPPATWWPALLTARPQWPPPHVTADQGSVYDTELCLGR